MLQLPEADEVVCSIYHQIGVSSIVKECMTTFATPVMSNKSQCLMNCCKHHEQTVQQTCHARLTEQGTQKACGRHTAALGVRGAGAAAQNNR